MRLRSILPRLRLPSAKTGLPPVTLCPIWIWPGTRRVPSTVSACSGGCGFSPRASQCFPWALGRDPGSLGFSVWISLDSFSLPVIILIYYLFTDFIITANKENPHLNYLIVPIALCSIVLIAIVRGDAAAAGLLSFWGHWITGYFQFVYRQK